MAHRPTIWLRCPPELLHELRARGLHTGYNRCAKTDADTELLRVFNITASETQRIDRLRTWIEQRDAEADEVPGAKTTLWLPEPGPAELRIAQTAAGERLVHVSGASVSELIRQLPDCCDHETTHVINEIREIQVFDRHAYNASALPTSEGYFLVYRRDLYTLTSCHLDHQWVTVPGTRSDLGTDGNIDARLFRFFDSVMMSTCFYGGELPRTELWTFLSLHPAMLGPRLAFTKIHDWPQYKPQWEKNWLPVCTAGSQLYYIYSIAPLRTLTVDFRTPDTAARLTGTVPWEPPWPDHFGNELRGSAPPAPLPDGSLLLAFHTVDSNRGYHTGLLRIEGTHPFRPIAVSRRPIIGPLNSSRSCMFGGKVIFVQSLLVNLGRDELILVGGDNDHRVIRVSASLSGALAELAPIVLS